MVWRVGWEAPPKLSLLTTLPVFYNSSMEACYQKPEGEKEAKKNQRDTDRQGEREKETGREGGSDGDYGINSDIKNIK